MPAEYVETREVPLAQLTPFPGNAKRGDVDTIRESIKRNGQYRSLVVQDTGNGLVILAGNHTYQALRADKSATARCEIVRCDDQTARRINLVDNRASDKGSYDTDSLAELLSYLDSDYDGTGYDQKDVDRLLDGFVGDREVDAPEEFPAYDEDLETEYQCPKCSYQWSGKAK